MRGDDHISGGVRRSDGYMRPRSANLFIALLLHPRTRQFLLASTVFTRSVSSPFVTSHHFILFEHWCSLDLRDSTTRRPSQNFSSLLPIRQYEVRCCCSGIFGHPGHGSWIDRQARSVPSERCRRVVRGHCHLDYLNHQRYYPYADCNCLPFFSRRRRDSNYH